MLIAVSIVICMLADPDTCQTVPLHLSVPDMQACIMAGEEVAARMAPEWRLDHVRCSPGFIDEHQG